MTPEHERLIEAALTEVNNAGTRTQLARWARQILEWVEGEGLEYRSGDRELRERYRRHFEHTVGDGARRRWDQRAGVFNRLDRAASAIEARLARARPSTFGACVDALVPGSALDRAIESLVRTTPGQARTRTELGRFLRWCAVSGRDPLAVGLLELRAFRAHLTAEGVRPGPYVVTARKFVRSVNPGPAWWRQTATHGGSQSFVERAHGPAES